MTTKFVRTSTFARWEPEKPNLPELEKWISGKDQYYFRVKQSSKRSVYALRPESGSEPSIFLKHDHPQDLREMVKIVLRPRVLREYRAGKALEELGIPVPESLACTWKRGEGVLVTRAIPNAKKSLDLWYYVQTIPERRQKYLTCLSRFLLLLLDKNVWHPDLHLGNILAVERDDAVAFYLVDLHRVKLVHRLSVAQKREMLQLLATFKPDISDNEARDVLRPLFEFRHESEIDDLWQSLCRSSIKRAHKRWTKRRKDLLRDSSVCRKIRTSFGIWHLRHGFGLQVAESVVRAHQGAPANLRKSLFKDSRKYCVSRVSVQESHYVVRESYRPGPWKRFSSDRRSWLNNWRLELYGIPVAKYLGWLRAGNGHGYLIMEYIEGVSYDKALELSRDDVERQTYLIGCLFALVQRLYERGIVHADLGGQNLIVINPLSYRSLFPRWYPDSAIEKPEILLVDNDAVQFNVRIREKHIRRNLRHIVNSLPAADGLKKQIANDFLRVHHKT